MEGSHATEKIDQAIVETGFAAGGIAQGQPQSFISLPQNSRECGAMYTYYHA